ncbi:hypothetical protein GE107_25935 [Cohnella sp. CFH 77786]|uniref:hypothetical protein n=1 Tax=Cohnella sp. CFH 77786 TaxID=2662265 RepID=UPI001C6095D2|nr:hypothetical protein [Cohnella sp. CFH 77786]MBW5449455.1 hypothetical protein [Cohnella sp. CFH 77786]
MPNQQKKVIVLSVASIIIEPKDIQFYVPVSTEAFFQSCWVPAIKELNLQLISLFNPGLDLTKKDLSHLIEELEILKKWAETNLDKDEYNYMKRRIDFLIVKLIEVFTNDEVVVFIG